MAQLGALCISNLCATKPYAAGKITKQALDDSKVNIAFATANLASAQVAVGAAAASAVASSATYGFTIGANGERIETTTTTNTEQSQWQGSNLDVNNLKIKAEGQDVNIQGSRVNATGTTIFDQIKDLNVTAGVERTKQDSSSKTNSQSVSYTYGGGGSASIGKQTSKSQSESLTHVNSDVVLNRTEGEIDQLSIKGGNVSIADRGNLQVNEIYVESLQDTASSSNSSKGGTIGAGFGSSGLSNVTAGYNQGKGKSDSAWVNEISKLLIGNAQNDADLDAMGVNKVTNVGGVIANATKNTDGTLTDHGNLNYSGDLELKDIEDNNYNSSSGFNVSTTIGKTTQEKDGQKSKYPNGSTTIGLNSSGQETEQLTKATFGQGTVKNATDSTNRDINNTQEITRDQTTGMLDGSVTVDHRLLTEDGRKEIIQDHKDVANAIKDTVAIVEGIIESRDFIKNYESSTQNMTIDEKNTLDNLLQSFQAGSKDNTNTWVVVVTEGVAVAGSTCARVPACVSAVVNLFGAVTAEKILNSGEEKKETHPKGVPSTSGNSATGMPPNGDDDGKETALLHKPIHDGLFSNIISK